MATDDAGANAHNSRIKTAFQLAVHVPVWALVALGYTLLEDTPQMESGDASETWARFVGFATIGFGLIAAGLGACAGYLEDSEEASDLRHERPALLLGAGALLTAGSSLILLSLAGPRGLVPGTIGLPVALLLNVCSTVLVAIRWRRLDELNRGLARDAGYLAFTCFSWVGGTWAMLAHMEMAPAPAPLDWLTMLNGFSFAAGIVAAARKGIFDTTADSSGPLRR